MDFSIFIVLYSLDHYLCCAARRVRFFVTIWATGGQAARLFYPWDFSGKLLDWVAISSSTIYCRTFLSPLEEPHLPIPFDPPALGNHRLLSVPMGFPVLHFISLDSYNVWPFFTEHHVYKVHPRCNLHQYLIHFYGSVRSRCADM